MLYFAGNTLPSVHNHLSVLCKEDQEIHMSPKVNFDRILPQFVLGTLRRGWMFTPSSQEGILATQNFPEIVSFYTPY